MSAPTDATLMTLAGIAYGYPTKIAKYLQEADPTDGWQVAWLPEISDTPPNFMFVAHDGGNRYVVAIRGTYPNPLSKAYWDDGAQDSPFGDMVDWPGTEGAKIAKGTNEGFTNLMALAAPDGTDLLGFVSALPANAEVTVTGHSLGGTLTPVVALKLAQTGASITATSFAGMTPGNKGFAALFDAGTKLAGKVRRVYNDIDSVGYGWNNVWATHKFFKPAPRASWLVKAALLLTVIRLWWGKYHFADIGQDLPLNGVVRPPQISNNLIAYVSETLHQHMPDTYLALLGAPPLPFSIIWGTVLAPRDSKAAQSDGVVHLE